MKKEQNIIHQQGLVLNHLQHKKYITSWEAIQNYGITRLSAVIFNLRESGWNIQDEWIEEYNRYGQKTRFKRYFLVQEKKTLHLWK